MRRLLRFSIAILVLGLTFSTARWAFGQAPQFGQDPQTQTPTIISGNDVGFRVDRQTTERVGKLTGTWVVRVNGQWIEPEPLRASRPLSSK